MSTAKSSFEKVMPVFKSNIKMYQVEKKGFTNIKGNLNIPKSLLAKCTKGCSISLEWQANDTGWTDKRGNEPIGFIKIAGFNQEVKGS